MRYVIKLIQWIDRFSDSAGKIISFLVPIMIGVLCYEVVMRYLFNAPTFWGHETTQHLFGGYAVLIGGYALRHRAHVTVDVLYQHWSPRLQARIDSVTWLMFWLFCGLLLWHGGDAAITSTIRLDHTSTVWSPPMYPLKLTIPIGAFLVCLQGLSIYLRKVYFAITGRELAPEAEIAGGAGE